MSHERDWLENMRKSRIRGAEVARTLSNIELEELLDAFLRRGGEGWRVRVRVVRAARRNLARARAIHDSGRLCQNIRRVCFCGRNCSNNLNQAYICDVEF